MLKTILIFIMSGYILFASSAGDGYKPMPEFETIKVYEVDENNNLSLLDTALIEQFDMTNQTYNDTTILKDFINVTYDDGTILGVLYHGSWQMHDTTYDDGVTTYEFASWCKRDTVDTEINTAGKRVYEIEYENCKIKDILKYDDEERLIHYTYQYQGRDRSEDYKYNSYDKLIDIKSPKGIFRINYDEYGRIDTIEEDIEDLTNIFKTGGDSIKRTVIYKFEYE